MLYLSFIILNLVIFLIYNQFLIGISYSYFAKHNDLYLFIHYITIIYLIQRWNCHTLNI